MLPSRRHQNALQDSWRLVDGQDDSFHTSILPPLPSDDDDDDDKHLLPPPSKDQQPLSSHFSQPSHTQHQSSSGTHDSFRVSAKPHPSHQHLILDELFRPSIVSSSSVAPSPRQRKYQTPAPEFKMPVLDSDGQSTQPSKTYQPSSDDHSGIRHRNHVSSRRTTTTTTPVKRTIARHAVLRDTSNQRQNDAPTPHSSSLPFFFFFFISIFTNIIQWTAAVMGLAFQYAKRPLALLLAVYLFCGAIIITQNMLQRSIYVSLSPLCRVPGVSLLSLPFCPLDDAGLGAKKGGQSGPPLADPVEFDDLMNVQAKFEDVLEKAVDGTSLPFEIKRSEIGLRDLRTLVKHSDIQARDELVLEFDGFIDMARRSASDLQRFNTHIGSAVDAVISINRWTSRYLDTLAPLSHDSSSSSHPVSAASSALAAWSDWLFSPFQPTAAQHVVGEAMLRDKYIEHTTLVSQRLATLILEAQAILRLLVKADDHLALLYELSSRSTAVVDAERRDKMRWKLWSLVGGNARRLDSLAKQLALLAQVDRQRDTAVAQVSALLLELEAIQAELGGLRDRVAEPGVLRDAASPAAALPLTVHIETINLGVERLEAARQRIRAAEDDRVRAALAQGGLRDDLISDKPAQT